MYRSFIPTLRNHRFLLENIKHSIIIQATQLCGQSCISNTIELAKVQPNISFTDNVFCVNFIVREYSGQLQISVDYFLHVSSLVQSHCLQHTYHTFKPSQIDMNNATSMRLSQYYIRDTEIQCLRFKIENRKSIIHGQKTRKSSWFHNF